MENLPKKKFSKKIINNQIKHPDKLIEFIYQNKKYLKKFYIYESNRKLLIKKIATDIEKIKEDIKKLESKELNKSKVKIKKEYLNNLEEAYIKLQQMNFKK